MFDLVADVGRYGEFLPWVNAVRVRSNTDTLRRLALDHEVFVRRIARERTLLDRRFYVVVPAGMDGAFERTRLRWPWRGAQRERQRNDLVAASRKLAFRCSEVLQGLGSFGVVGRRLDGEELAALWRATLGAVPVGVSRRAPLVATPVVIRPQRADAAGA